VKVDGKSQKSGGAPRSRAGGACEAPPHKDGNRLADQLLSWIYALYPHSRAVGYCDKINQKDFKCQICGKTFFTRIFLDEHNKIKHKNQDLVTKVSGPEILFCTCSHIQAV
jgi:hypothetical protein